ncbi:hypothetical protein ACTXHA_03970 [Burkholderia cenocepacia]
MNVYDIKTGRRLPLSRRTAATRHIDTHEPHIRRALNELWALTPELLKTYRDTKSALDRLLTLSIQVDALLRVIDQDADTQNQSTGR